jgi:hypothetical protein
MDIVTMVKLPGDYEGMPIYAPLMPHDQELLGDQSEITFELKGRKAQRTLAQNNSIRLYCKWLSEAFNNAGYGIKYVLSRLSKKDDWPWSPDLVLERLWRPTQEHTYGTTSTTKLETDQVGIVYEALNQATSQEVGIGINFPDKYLKLYEEENK